MAPFNKWKEPYLALLSFHNDLGVEFKEIFSPNVFIYNKREAFLFFSSLTLALYAVLTNKIEQEAQTKFAQLQLDGIFQHFSQAGKPTLYEIAGSLEERQNELFQIVAKGITGEMDAKTTLEAITNSVFSNVFNADGDQYEIVYPLLFSTLGKYLDKALSEFRF
ncbi:MAG: hypothetical protein K9N21_13670 [Deltaproteobacteria bacterium]|nr:hypothetical protein [Deltaproteobacteria bacterium]